MDEQLKKYKFLSYELLFAQKVVNELEGYDKVIPIHCPMHKKNAQDLLAAKAIRDDIKKDINDMADNELALNLNWRPSR